MAAKTNASGSGNLRSSGGIHGSSTRARLHGGYVPDAHYDVDDHHQTDNEYGNDHSTVEDLEDALFDHHLTQPSDGYHSSSSDQSIAIAVDQQHIQQQQRVSGLVLSPRPEPSHMDYDNDIEAQVQRPLIDSSLSPAAASSASIGSPSLAITPTPHDGLLDGWAKRHTSGKIVIGGDVRLKSGANHSINGGGGAGSSDESDRYFDEHRHGGTPSDRDVSSPDDDLSDDQQHIINGDHIDQEDIVGNKRRCCSCCTKKRLIMSLVFTALLLFSIALVIWELFKLLETSVVSSAIIIDDLCTHQAIGANITANIRNPSWFTVIVGPAAIWALTADNVRYARVDVPAIPIRHGDNPIKLSQLQVTITNELKYIEMLQFAAGNATIPELKYEGNVPLAIDMAFGSIKINKDINDLISSESDDDGDEGHGGDPPQPGEPSETIFQKALNSASMTSSSFTQPGEPGVYLLGDMSIAFRAGQSSFGVMIPSLSLHWLIRLNGDATKEQHIMHSQTTSFAIGGADIVQHWNVSAQVTQQGYDRLRDVATQLWNNEQTQIVVHGSGEDEPLQAQCYLQWTLDRLVLPITIPTASNGKPLLQLDSLHLSKYSGSSYSVDSQIMINSPLIRHVSTPSLRFDVLFRDELLGQMILPSIELKSNTTHYSPSLALTLSDDPGRETLQKEFLSSVLLEDDIGLVVRATDANDKLAGLLASCVQSVSFQGLAFLRTWMKKLIGALSLSSFTTAEGQSSVIVGLPIHNPFSAIVVQNFYTLLRDTSQVNASILSIALNRTVLLPGDTEVDALVTVYTGSSLGTFFHHAFFGEDLHVAVDMQAGTDMTGSFELKGYEVDIDGHNYFKDVVQHIVVKPTFPVFKLLWQECVMDVEGTALVVNPLPVDVILHDVHFDIMLHDDIGSFGYPPLPKDKPIHVGLAKMVPFPVQFTMNDTMHKGDDISDSHVYTDDELQLLSAIASFQGPSSSSSSLSSSVSLAHDIILPPGSSHQPVRMRLVATNWEVCLRTAGAALRRDIRVDLVKGNIELMVDEESQPQKYSQDFEAKDVDVPL